MKTIITTLILTVSFISCKAQTVYNLNNLPEDVPFNNVYLKDVENHFDALVGVWKWEQGNNSFEVTLQKFEKYKWPAFSTSYDDIIFGKYTYIENGNVLSEVTSIETFPNVKLVMQFQSPTEYTIRILDVASDKSLGGTFVINSNGTATFNLDTTRPSSGGYYHPSNPPSSVLFSLPANATLIKQ